MHTVKGEEMEDICKCQIKSEGREKCCKVSSMSYTAAKLEYIASLHTETTLSSAIHSDNL